MGEIIKLTKGYITIVDKEDYELLRKHSWCVNIKKTPAGKIKPYAIRASRDKDGKRIKIAMHNAIMKPENKGLIVDHINSITLDNRRVNLRLCTNKQNTFNSQNNLNKSNKYRGVYYRKDVDKYRVRLNVNGTLKHLGYFEEADEAAKAYNKVVKKHRGEYAILNKIPS